MLCSKAFSAGEELVVSTIGRSCRTLPASCHVTTQTQIDTTRSDNTSRMFRTEASYDFSAAQFRPSSPSLPRWAATAMLQPSKLRNSSNHCRLLQHGKEASSRACPRKDRRGPCEDLTPAIVRTVPVYNVLVVRRMDTVKFRCREVTQLPPEDGRSDLDTASTLGCQECTRCTLSSHQHPANCR